MLLSSLISTLIATTLLTTHSAAHLEKRAVSSACRAFTTCDIVQNTASAAMQKLLQQHSIQIATLQQQLATIQKVIQLKQGPQGNPGLQGVQGVQGVAGAVGPKGAQGTPGLPGTTGLPGKQGSPGFPGSAGPKGLPGTPGLPGAQGSQGAKGANGAPGAVGPQGPIGLPGKSTSIPDYVATPAALTAFIANDEINIRNDLLGMSTCSSNKFGKRDYTPPATTEFDKRHLAVNENRSLDKRQSLDPYLGGISLFASNWCPQDWLLADGSLLAVSDYNSLFSVLGTQYGGDGESTFGIPNLLGQSLQCATWCISVQGTYPSPPSRRR